jgi:hypothetical protein
MDPFFKLLYILYKKPVSFYVVFVIEEMCVCTEGEQGLWCGGREEIRYGGLRFYRKYMMTFLTFQRVFVLVFRDISKETKLHSSIKTLM